MSGCSQGCELVNIIWKKLLLRKKAREEICFFSSEDHAQGGVSQLLLSNAEHTRNLRYLHGHDQDLRSGYRGEMAVSATLLTWQSGQSICVCMLHVLAAVLATVPTDLLAHKNSNLQPGERSMVSAEEEALSHKVQMEMPGKSNHSQ